MSVLIFFSVVAVAFGLLAVSKATTGVAFVAFGCYLAILARIVQANKKEKDDS